MKQLHLLLFLTTFFANDSFCQLTAFQHIPVTINSPLFNKEDRLQIGTNINNYGVNHKIAAQSKGKFVFASLQQNFGLIEFDPLHFNRYYIPGEEFHLIQSKPSGMLYYELGFGYNFQPKTQKVSLAAGVGREFLAPNTRLFLQIDWGAEQRLIDFGIAARGNYTSILGIDLFTLEPAIQGKIKIRNFRIVNQFGYSIPLKKNQQYMKPILTLGIEYVLSRSTDNNTLPKATQN